MKVVFFGTPNFAVPCLQKLLDPGPFEVVAVVTQPDKRRGRGAKMTPSPVKVLALEQDLPVWQPPRLKKDPEVLAQLEAAKADVFVVVAYGQLLSPRVLAMPRLGCVNVHGSLLPAYRGAAPIQWCLYRGETETGITTMVMDRGMDTGDMLLKATLPLSLAETAQGLTEKLMSLGADLLVDTLRQWQDLTPIPQDPTLATYAPLIQKFDYELDWSRSALALHNQIRGFFPNSTTLFRHKPLKISTTIPWSPEISQTWPQTWTEEQTLLQQIQPSSDSVPGTVVALLKGYGPVVQTGRGLLLLTQVQPPGKRVQSGWDFANGARVAVGERLGEKTEERSEQ
jgi:methionyl-tRNA formyltransferase